MSNATNGRARDEFPLSGLCTNDGSPVIEQAVYDAAMDAIEQLHIELASLRTALVRWVYADDGWNGNREDSSLRALIPNDDWGIDLFAT